MGLRTAAVFCLFCHATTHTSQANEDCDKEEERLQVRDPRKILWSLLLLQQLLQQQQSRCENASPTREGLGCMLGGGTKAYNSSRKTHTHTYLSMTISCWLIEDALLPAAAADATIVTWRCLATDGT